MRKRILSLCMALVMMCLLMPSKAAAETNITRMKTTVHVKTDEGLKSAMSNAVSDTTIILESGDYHTDWSLDLWKVNNVTIQGTGKTRILGSDLEDTVFSFHDCTGIILKELTIGHDAPSDGGCTAGVIQGWDSGVTILDCDIFGCGQTGLTMMGIDADTPLTVKNTVIRDCSGGIFDLGNEYNSSYEINGTASFENCIFSGNGYRDPWKYGISVGRVSSLKMTFTNCTFKDNKNPNFIYIPERDTDAVTYTLENCTFTNNAWGTVKNTVTSSTPEYVYDTTDPGENTKLPTDALERVTDPVSAVNAVKQLTDGMTSEQKSSPTGIDLATLYAETAVSKAARKEVNSGEVLANAASVTELAAAAVKAADAVEDALSSGGVTTARYLIKTITFTTEETDISIQVDPDILTTEADRLQVETPAYALTLNLADLKEDLTEPLTFRAQEGTASYALKRNGENTTVTINLPKVQMTNPVIVSLPKSTGSTTYQAVVKTDGTATSSKYNPAKLTVDGRINTSGTYTVKTNEKTFSDISNKSAEMQKAILYLTSKGIINGTSATTFSPDGAINRQQIAALLMRALGKVDNTAATTFTDVSKSSSLYHAIASSQKHGIINGYADNTFRGANAISRAQIVTVSGRVLTSEMNYKVPSNKDSYLGKYSDTVPDFARDMVALATREGLIVYRSDGTFSGGKSMTRGDAAIILYRLFQKIW